MSNSDLPAASRQRVALVTGASRGIGRATALRLAAAGNLVLVHYGSDAAAAAATVDAITSAGGSAVAIPTKLGDVGDGERLAEAAAQALAERGLDGEIDVLVSNAGIAGPSALESTDDAWLDELFEVNAKAPFRLLRALAPRLRDGGRVVAVTTGLVRIPRPEFLGYSLSKAAVDTLVLHLAQSLGTRGITVNAVAPGVIDTDMNAGWLGEPEARASVAAMSPLGRLGTADDVAKVIAWLASDDAEWVSGQTVDAFGGAFG